MFRKNTSFKEACNFWSLSIVISLLSSCAHINAHADGGNNYPVNPADRKDESFDISEAQPNVLEAIALLEEEFGGKFVIGKINLIDDESRDPFTVDFIDGSLIEPAEFPFNIEKLKEVRQIRTDTQVEIGGSGCTYVHQGGDPGWHPPGCN